MKLGGNWGRVLILSCVMTSLCGAFDAKAQKRVDVEKLKKQYWSEDSDFDVVQNRIYSKKRRVELNVIGGFAISDPFLSVKPVGGSLGYHFSEYFSVHALGFKYLTSGSSALERVETQLNATPDTNSPHWYGGGEARLSLIYGKLSLLGKGILYYDLHFSGGVGETGTASGNYFTQHLGVGQQVWVTQGVAVLLDYRLLHYHEDILGSGSGRPSLKGQKVDERQNWTSAITLGVGLFF